MTRETVLAHIRPAGPADAEAIALIRATAWRETYGDMLPAKVITRAEAVWGASHWRQVLNRIDGETTVLVLDSEPFGVLGFAAFGPQRGGVPDYDAELYAIYLPRSAQGQGGGRALIAAMARVLAAQGQGSALVWALSRNMRARRFYEALGGVPIGPRVTTLFGEDLAEAGYGWRDLHALAHDATAH